MPKPIVVVGGGKAGVEKSTASIGVIDTLLESGEPVNICGGNRESVVVQSTVMRNGYFGDEQKFARYDESKLRTQVENAGGKSLTFPDLAGRVSDDLYSKRQSNGAAMQTLPIGNRAELAHSRREVHRIEQAD